MHFLKQPNPEKLSRQFRDRKISRREFNATAGQMINYFT